MFEASSNAQQLTAERILEAFQKAGLPKDVLQVLHLSPDLVKHTVKHPLVSYISFTGSVRIHLKTYNETNLTTRSQMERKLTKQQQQRVTSKLLALR